MSKSDREALKQDLILVSKVAFLYILAFFLQFRFYWDQLTKDRMTGDYYAPYGFKILPERKVKLMENARLISVIRPDSCIKIYAYSERMTFVDVDICWLVNKSGA